MKFIQWTLGWDGCLNLFLLNWAPFLRSKIAKVEKKEKIFEQNLKHPLAVRGLSRAVENFLLLKCIFMLYTIAKREFRVYLQLPRTFLHT